MPVENERKFLLIENDSVEKLFIESADRAIWIEQKYLASDRGLSVRVRLSACEGVHTHYMTVKQDVDGECVEIETIISEEDFRKLWSKGTGKVTKIRYIYQGWEVDFFKDKKKNTYLAVAEIELPPKVQWPESIPDLIEKHILFTVPVIDGQNDRRFSNKKLGDIEYSRSLLQEIKSKSRIHLVKESPQLKLKKKTK